MTDSLLTKKDCLFCKIVAGEIPADIVYQDDDVIAFNDITPQAPHHLLIIPRQHISTINDIRADDKARIGSLYLAAQTVAKQRGFADDGYRVVMNCNEDGGQSVYHIHLHVLAGRTLQWPPG